MTGCTDGIGKAYCLRMCRKIDKFVLIGRNREKLAKLTAEMKEINSKVETIEILADFAGHVDYPALEKKLASLDIGVFMNFVGVSYPLPQMIHKMDADYPNLSWDHINVNLVSATQLSRVIVPKMVERKSGLVVYVSSGLTIRLIFSNFIEKVLQLSQHHFKAHMQRERNFLINWQ